MAGVSRNPDRDRPMDFQGLLNNLQDWDHMFKENDRKSKGAALGAKKQGSSRNAGKVDEDKGPPKKVPATEVSKKTNTFSEVRPGDRDERYNYLRYSDAVSEISSRFLNEEKAPDAASEKELGNEYFKQKKFLEAIECYSRSIALSPSAVAFANRAMAYLKIKRYEEAENDCTEALNLDDRYVKAYSRRASARKELGKLKASIEDSEFAIRLEPNTQELRKQYTETKALYEKAIAKKNSGALRASTQGIQEVGNSEMESKDVKVPSFSNNAERPAMVAVKTSNMNHHSVGAKHEMEASIQDIASRAASRVMATAAKNITAPKSAYEFEVSWRALSDDCELQANLLKTIPPATLPGIFKNALSAPVLVDIVKCTATFLKEDTELAVNILDNLAKVPRFDMIVMCLSAVDRSGLHRIWEEVFSSKDIRADYVETLSRLQSKYCTCGW